MGPTAVSRFGIHVARTQEAVAMWAVPMAPSKVHLFHLTATPYFVYHIVSESLEASREGRMGVKKHLLVNTLLLLSLLCGIPPAEADEIFGNLDGLQISGTVSADQYADRRVEVSVKDGNLRGTVTAERYDPRILSLSFQPSGLVGSFSAKNIKERLIDLAINGMTLEGTVNAEGYEPRSLVLDMNGGIIEGKVSAAGYADRIISLSMDDRGVTGTVEAEGYSTREINFQIGGNGLQGTISAEGSADRRVNFEISRVDPGTLRMALLLLFLDMRILAQRAGGTQFTSLNLNTNLNLP